MASALTPTGQAVPAQAGASTLRIQLGAAQITIISDIEFMLPIQFVLPARAPADVAATLQARLVDGLSMLDAYRRIIVRQIPLRA